MKALILYISGPMTGMDGLNYKRFDDIERTLRGAGYWTRNPANIDIMYPQSMAEQRGEVKRTYEWYLKRAIKMMLEADAVATLEGWEQSRGAGIECRLARELKMPVKPWREWMLATVMRKPTSWVVDWS